MRHSEAIHSVRMDDGAPATEPLMLPVKAKYKQEKKESFGCNQHVIESDGPIGDVQCDEAVGVGGIGCGDKELVVVVDLDGASGERQADLVKGSGFESDAGGGAELSQACGIDIPSDDAVQDDFVILGVEPDGVTGAGGGVDAAADAAGVIKEGREADGDFEGVVSPRGIPDIGLGMAAAVVRIDTGSNAPAACVTQRGDSPTCGVAV